jgi:hypothetical protein
MLRSTRRNELLQIKDIVKTFMESSKSDMKAETLGVAERKDKRSAGI